MGLFSSQLKVAIKPLHLATPIPVAPPLSEDDLSEDLSYDLSDERIDDSSSARRWYRSPRIRLTADLPAYETPPSQALKSSVRRPRIGSGVEAWIAARKKARRRRFRERADKQT